MRIGIDIDDTIAKTSILYSQKKELYLKNHSLKMSQTARNNTYVDTIKDVLDFSKKWLLKNQIPIDQIYIDCYCEEKAKIAKELHLDYLIDDDIHNIIACERAGISTIHFDIVQNNWKMIEKIIKK